MRIYDKLFTVGATLKGQVGYPHLALPNLLGEIFILSTTETPDILCKINSLLVSKDKTILTLKEYREDSIEEYTWEIKNNQILLIWVVTGVEEEQLLPLTEKDWV